MKLISCSQSSLLYLVLFVFLPLPATKAMLHYLITKTTSQLLPLFLMITLFSLNTKIFDINVKKPDIINNVKYNYLNLIKLVLFI